MSDAHTKLNNAVRSARRTKRSVGRIVFSVAGFSAAYFLDPAHGEERRKQLMGYLHRVGGSLNEVVSQEAGPIRDLRPVEVSAAGSGSR
ncbi:MAG TPA: hypothetical protein VGG38_12025 [Acidimicrobiales bacterium]|jgi:hypothetical protein